MLAAGAPAAHCWSRRSTAAEPDEPDFAEEHTKPTYADEHADDPGMDADESTPDDSGGMDVRGSKPT